MNNYEINQSTVRWLKRRFKILTDDVLVEKASEIVQNYREENKEIIKREEKLNQECFESTIFKELLYLRLFGSN